MILLGFLLVISKTPGRQTQQKSFSLHFLPQIEILWPSLPPVLLVYGTLTPRAPDSHNTTQWKIMADLCHYLSGETLDVDYIFSH